VTSWQAHVVRRTGVAFVRATRSSGGGEPTIDDLPRIRAGMEKAAGRMRLHRETIVGETNLNGIPAERITTPRSVSDRAVLYLHGGAYVLCSPRTHRGLASAVAFASHSQAWVIEYRLAPEHPYPAALQDGLRAWDELAQRFAPERIAIVGDSAGGGLAVQLLVALRDRGGPLPGCAALMSPWVDLSGSGPTMWERNARDPWLPAELMHLPAQAYAGDLDVADPRVSPLFADLRGLPPLLVHCGTDEIVHDDATRLVERAKAAGVDATIGIWPGMFHVFQAFPGIPERRRALREIGGFIRRHVPDSRAVAPRRLVG